MSPKRYYVFYYCKERERGVLDDDFETKEEAEARCQEIINNSKNWDGDGAYVSEDY